MARRVRSPCRDLIFLDLDDLLAAAHTALRGPPPIRDLGLLQSALGRPQTTVFGNDAYPTLYTKAAALLHSLTANHALVDGNKRVALAATLLFFEFNGVTVLPNSDAYDLMIDVASGALDDVSEIARRLESWPTAGQRTEK